MCLFCEIAAHRIPADIIYEDENIMAFLDINPVSKGHTLLIPKKHYDDFTQCSSALVSRMHGVSRRLIKKYDQTLHPDGYNFLSNAKAVAGQSVFHVHFHLIPRYTLGDGLRLHFEGNPELRLTQTQIQALKKPR